MSKIQATDGQQLRRRHIRASLQQLVLGSLTLYMLCSWGGMVIEYLTTQITTPFLLTLVVGSGLAAADVGALMLIFGGVRHLWKALYVKATPVGIDTDS